MSWFRVDDGFHNHPKVIAAGTAAVGLFARCGSYCSQQLTDGYVPDEVVRGYGTRAQIDRLIRVGMFERVDGGYQLHDFLDRNPSRVEVLSERARRKELRDPAVKEAVRARDGSVCRYCGRNVDWRDRRSAVGGTYDHVIPGLAGGVDNLVVACRGCNSAKRDRTPEQAGMPLRPPPGVPPPGPGAYLGQTWIGPESGPRSVQAPDPTRPVSTAQRDTQQRSRLHVVNGFTE